MSREARLKALEARHCPETYPTTEQIDAEVERLKSLLAADPHPEWIDLPIDEHVVKLTQLLEETE